MYKGKHSSLLGWWPSLFLKMTGNTTPTQHIIPYGFNHHQRRSENVKPCISMYIRLHPLVKN